MASEEVNGTGIPIETNDMSLRTGLKREGTKRGRRWIVKRDKDDNIREVKLIFNPNEYSTITSRKMYGDRQLIAILDAERENNAS